MKRSVGPQTLAMPTPVWLVGTYDADGRPNLMTAAWAGICCSQPPCVAVSLRRATHSYAAIEARQAFTINIPSETQAKEADYVGRVSGARTDKFAACGWTAVRCGKVDAPAVAEIPLVLECRLIHRIELGLHTQFVGQIVDVQVDPDCTAPNGYPDILKIRPMVWDPAQQGYFGIGGFLGHSQEIGNPVGAAAKK
jgi:flavin reductase (DIM6/NTAB) family NADH-FMN oxidoreductase RutF